MTDEFDQAVEQVNEEPAAEPAPADPAGPNKFILLLKSRKFWAAFVGLALVVVKQADPTFPLAEDQVTNLVYVVVAYILGTSLEDGLRAKSQSVNS